MKNDILTVLLVVLFFSLIGSIHLNRNSRKEIKETRIELRTYRDNHDALQIAFERCMEDKNSLYEIHKVTLESEKRLSDEIARLHNRNLEISYYYDK